MNAILPPFLSPGDTIAIAASARKINTVELENTIQLLKDNGYRLVFAENLYDTYFQFAGTDEARASGLQQLLDDPSINAILFARGGYGTVRIMKYIQWNNFIKNPKWLIGFSDITVIHSWLHQLNICSVHGPLAINMGEMNEQTSFYISESTRRNTMDLLKGSLQSYDIPNHELNNFPDYMEGKISGGNLSVLQSISATKYDLIPEDEILLLEDIDENLYHFDRMMQWLINSGKLKKIKALGVGHLTKMKNLDEKNPFGKSAFEIMRDVADEAGIPIIFNLPFGHEFNNYPFILSARYTFQKSEQGFTIAISQHETEN